jgi:hypothetical protein
MFEILGFHSSGSNFVETERCTLRRNEFIDAAYGCFGSSNKECIISREFLGNDAGTVSVCDSRILALSREWNFLEEGLAILPRYSCTVRRFLDWQFTRVRKDV